MKIFRTMLVSCVVGLLFAYGTTGSPITIDSSEFARLEKTQNETHSMLIEQHYNLKLIQKILMAQGKSLAQAGRSLQGLDHIQETDPHSHHEGGGHHAWSYDGHFGPGPNNWVQLSDECGGVSESPINIVDDNAEAQPEESDPFILNGYDVKPYKAKVSNNGHSIKMTIDMGNNSMPTISGGMLPGEYEFAQLHFHWGSNSEMGSEHTFEGLRFPMELHLVHFKKEHGSIGEALKHPDGLAVFGVWFEISVFRKAPRWMHSIAKAAKQIEHAGDHWYVPDHRIYPLRELFPNDLERYYRYQGSLTTPPCTQVVVWTMFREPLTIRAETLAVFRDVNDPDGHNLVDNFRPLQELNERTVLKVGMTG